MYKSLMHVPPSDLAYLLRTPMGERRLTSMDSDLTSRGFSVRQIKQLMNEYLGIRRIIFGNLVFDPGQGKTKYETLVLKGAQVLPENPDFFKIDMIPNYENAVQARREIVVRLARHNIPGEMHPSIRSFKGFGYIADAIITPTSSSDLPTIDKKLAVLISEIGVNPKDVQHPH